jgi:hypothetical protein
MTKQPQPTRETISQQHLAHTNADKYRHANKAAIEVYELRNRLLTPQDQMREAVRVYEVAIAMGRALFQKASPDLPEGFRPGLIPSGESRLLDLPALGYFLMTLGDINPDEPAFTVHTCTNTSLMGTEDDRVAYMGPDWRDAVHPPGSETILAHMQVNSDKFMVLGAEAKIQPPRPLGLATR